MGSRPPSLDRLGRLAYPLGPLGNGASDDEDEAVVANKPKAVSAPGPRYPMMQRAAPRFIMSLGAPFSPHPIDLRLPIDPRLQTTAFPGSDWWSVKTLPPILFFLYPPPSIYAGRPVMKLIENGRLVRGADGNRYINYFEILPRYVACDVPGWVLEAWYRTDSRITPADIVDRQCHNQDPITLNKVMRAMADDRYRFCRKPLGLLTDYTHLEVPPRFAVEVLEGLSLNNIRRNTILHPSAAPGWLAKVGLAQVDGRPVRVYKQLLNIDPQRIHQTAIHATFFMDNNRHGECLATQMKPDMRDAEELLYILQERANIHGLAHWSFLDDGCLPPSWSDGTASDDDGKDGEDAMDVDVMDIDVSEGNEGGEEGEIGEDAISSLYEVHGGCHECVADPDRDAIRYEAAHQEYLQIRERDRIFERDQIRMRDQTRSSGESESSSSDCSESGGPDEHHSRASNVNECSSLAGKKSSGPDGNKSSGLDGNKSSGLDGNKSSGPDGNESSSSYELDGGSSDGSS